MLNFTCVYILEDLTPSTQYSIHVTAVRLIGNKILEGNSSITVSGKTLFTRTVQGMYIVTHTNCNFTMASNTVLSYVSTYLCTKIYDAKFYYKPILYGC